MSNRAVVFTDVNRVEVRDVPMPDPAVGQVQIRTQFSGVSAGTEGWGLSAQFIWQPTPFPCVPGYQRVGEITKIGDGVSGFEVGQVVFATVGNWKGEVVPFWGSHIEVANVAADQVFTLPAGIDAVDAANAVVAQVGYNAASRPTQQPNDWVIVYGDGLIGQCAAQAARARGARVILIGHRNDRLALAAQVSADHVLNSGTESISERVQQITQGESIVALLDTVQRESVQQQYMPLLSHGLSQIVYCGFTPTATWADMALLQQRELTTHFISGWTRPRIEATLALMAEGKMNLRALTTHLVSPSQAPEMYALIQQKSIPFLGITFDWNQ